MKRFHKGILFIGTLIIISVASTVYYYYFMVQPRKNGLIMESKERIHISFRANPLILGSVIPSPFEPEAPPGWNYLSDVDILAGNYSVKYAGQAFASTLVIITTTLTQESVERATGKVKRGRYLHRIYSDNHELVSFLQEVALPAEYANISYHAQWTGNSVVELTMNDEGGEPLLKMFFKLMGEPRLNVESSWRDGENLFSKHGENITFFKDVAGNLKDYGCNWTIAYANISTSFPFYGCIQRNTYDFTAYYSLWRGLCIHRDVHEEYEISSVLPLQWQTTATPSSLTANEGLALSESSDLCNNRIHFLY